MSDFPTERRKCVRQHSMSRVGTRALLLTLLMTGCATVRTSPDEAGRQAQEQKDLQSGLNTGVLPPGSHLGTVTP